jgi:hypothetical protein
MKLIDPWEIEISDSIEHGSSPDVARAFTIIRWAYHGDLRPLSAALKSDDAIDDAVLTFLALMIDSGRLQVKPRHGHPVKPETVARDLLVAYAYEEKDETETSDAAIERLADAMAMSTQSVRQAITRKRKYDKRNAS